MNNKENSYKGKIITIPNLLSLFRILLIPIIVWLYCVEKKYELTILVLLISGASDIIDGFIARRFNMISDIGKALDPIVDKLTQGVTLICLLIDFPRLAILLCGLLIKEFLLGIKELYSIKKTGVVHGANWHGKLTTCMIYATLFVHIWWHDISEVVSFGLVAITFVIMCMSFAMYYVQKKKYMKENIEY